MLTRSIATWYEVNLTRSSWAFLILQLCVCLYVEEIFVFSKTFYEFGEFTTFIFLLQLVFMSPRFADLQRSYHIRMRKTSLVN